MLQSEEDASQDVRLLSVYPLSHLTLNDSFLGMEMNQGLKKSLELLNGLQGSVNTLIFNLEMWCK